MYRIVIGNLFWRSQQNGRAEEMAAVNSGEYLLMEKVAKSEL